MNKVEDDKEGINNDDLEQARKEILEDYREWFEEDTADVEFKDEEGTTRADDTDKKATQDTRENPDSGTDSTETTGSPDNQSGSVKNDEAATEAAQQDHGRMRRSSVDDGQGASTDEASEKGADSSEVDTSQRTDGVSKNESFKPLMINEEVRTEPEEDKTSQLGAKEPEIEDETKPLVALPEDTPTFGELQSLSQNDRQITVTEQVGAEGPGDKVGSPQDAQLETSGLHDFQVEPIEHHGYEPRILEAVDYGKGAIVRAPKTDLEKEGFEPEPGQNAIVQLGLRDLESEEVETVFARYNASDRRAEAYVEDIGGEKGSRYELVEARRVDEDMLARDFERGKCEHLENVRLEHVDDMMFLNVDNRRVELDDYRLSTSGAHAIIRGKIDGDDSCKIEFDGRRASVMFGRDYPVEEMRMEGDELVVRYAQSRNEKHEKRMYLEHLEIPERPSLNQFDQKEMLDHVKMFDHPERISGLYQFGLDKESQNEIKRLLEDADRRGGMQYEGTKAEISERLVPNLLEVCGWKMIERHPFSTKDKDSASANGTDWLVQTPDGKRVLLEVKWYGNKSDAIRKATTQVEDDFQDYKDDPRLKLEGAYIAIMEYDEANKDDSPIKIHVLRIQPLEELV